MALSDYEYGLQTAQQYTPQIAQILSQASNLYGVNLPNTQGIQNLIGSRLAAGKSAGDIISELPQSAPGEFQQVGGLPNQDVIYGAQQATKYGQQISDLLGQAQQIYGTQFPSTGGLSRLIGSRLSVGRTPLEILQELPTAAASEFTTGLGGDYSGKIGQGIERINALDRRRQEEIDNVNNNPWIVESIRRARIAQIDDKYDLQKGAVAKELALYQDQQEFFEKRRTASLKQAQDYFDALAKAEEEARKEEERARREEERAARARSSGDGGGSFTKVERREAQRAGLTDPEAIEAFLSYSPEFQGYFQRFYSKQPRRNDPDYIEDVYRHYLEVYKPSLKPEEEEELGIGL